MARHHPAPFRWHLFLASIVCISFLFVVKVRPEENNPIFDIYGHVDHYNKHRLYQEPLYAQANNSVRVSPLRRLAIIGSGISGAHIAHSFSDEDDTSPKVTLFERESRIGGRVHTVFRHRGAGERGVAIETGGSTFDAETRYLKGQIMDAGVGITDAYDGINPLAFVSTWDGGNITPSEDDQRRPSYESVSQMLWHHGWSLQVWKQLWCQIWKGESGIDYLPIHWRNAVREERSRSWIPPQNDSLNQFAQSWGLGTTPQKQVRTLHGTGGFLQRSIRIAGSSLNRNATVTRIRRHENLTFDVHWLRTSPDGSKKEHVERFDAVVIAAPFHQTGIEIDPPLPATPKAARYKPLHVTHFISLSSLDPTTFDLPEGHEVPDTLWDLRDQHERLAQRHSSVPPFQTLTRETSVFTSGCIEDWENIYRVTSEQPFTDDNVATLLNKSGVARGDITFPDQDCKYAEEFDEKAAAASNLSDEVEDAAWHWKYLGCAMWGTTKVRWIHRDFWPNAAVVKDGNVTNRPEPIELAPRLFYTSGFEATDGASISQSVTSAEKVVDGLFCGYLSSCPFW